MNEDNKEFLSPDSADLPQEGPAGGPESFDVSQPPSPETSGRPPQEQEQPSEQEPSLEGGETYNIGGPAYQPLPTTPYEEEIQSHLQEIIPLPQEQKLSELKRLAREKSVEKAVAVVKKMNDPWLEDRFHDDLMDDPELRAQLENLGKLEKL